MSLSQADPAAVHATGGHRPFGALPPAGGRLEAMPPTIEVERHGWHPARILAVVTVLAMVVFWIWAFSGAPDRHNPDYLSDRAWVDHAKVVCNATDAQIAKLPGAETAPNAKVRAGVINQADADLYAMIAKLKANPPDDAEDAKLVSEWLSDYGRYVDARQNYASRLRVDSHAELLLPEKFGNPLDDVITTFALDGNDMGACETPGDVG